MNGLLWCCIELNIGITGGCITALRPFARRYIPCLLSLSFKSYDSNSDGHPTDTESGPISLDTLSKEKRVRHKSVISSLKVPYPSVSDAGESSEDMLQSSNHNQIDTHTHGHGIMRTVEYRVNS